MYIFLPVTDNCPTSVSSSDRMAIEMISWPISTKECCQTRGSNPRPPEYQSDAHPNELPGLAQVNGKLYFLVSSAEWHQIHMNSPQKELLLCSPPNILHYKKQCYFLLFWDSWSKELICNACMLDLLVITLNKKMINEYPCSYLPDT